MRVLQSAIKLRETPTALNNAGAALVYLGRDQEAASYYKRALALDPDFRYWLNLGDSQRRIGEAINAAQAYRKGQQLAIAGLRTNPDNGEIRAYVAYFAARLGDRARSEQEISQALHLSPDSSQVIRMGVLTYNALHLPQDALRVAERATLSLLLELDHHPDMVQLRENRRFKELIALKTKGG